ncbi:unnamed protein product [Phaedon cochleariae]|uniref:Uncharacterized protein n=1 Tax=Phaedon cochleariae TaxID=80249 RepID=A0A9P0DTK5_PHACE|nr:unnamed protein product [Phaedon cochleariae]
MTKCSPSKCRSKTSFFFKVLVSIKQLLCTKKFCNGVGLSDIAKFMEKNNCLTGDLISQLENALCVAEASRLITRRKKLYLLVSPAANLHLVPEPCLKNKLEEIQLSFDSAQCPVDSKTICSTRQSKRIPPQDSCKLENNPIRKSPRTRKRVSRSKSRSRSRSRSKSNSPSKSRSASPCGGRTRKKKRIVKLCPPQPNSSRGRSKSPAPKPSKSCIKKPSCKELTKSCYDNDNVNSQGGKCCGSDSESSEN